ncbi:hypothetical protein F4859DRAFT_11704 [Xylaria cf. heliscus]|nr:hypothetical protein F4859DRAFT_11704 [Xylaria cf. heliscus]
MKLRLTVLAAVAVISLDSFLFVREHAGAGFVLGRSGVPSAAFLINNKEIRDLEFRVSSRDPDLTKQHTLSWLSHARSILVVFTNHIHIGIPIG